MAQKSSFFNAQLQSGVYDRTYLAEDFAAYFSSFIGNGVFPDPSTGLQLTAGTGMQVSLGSGKAWINGYYYVNTSACLFTLDTADGVLNRIDSVVIRWDKTARSITATVKKGAYAVTPAAPSLIRTEDVYELEVAEVSISAGSTSISQSDITDTRQNTSLCGIVAGVVDQIDTTGLFAQYNSAFQAFMASIEGTLSDDAAGNLLNLINQHKADSSVHITTLTHAKTGTVHALTGLNGATGILSCQFKATAAFAAGNTLKVDGTSYTIKLTNGEDAEDNLFVSGAIVSCIVDTAGKTVNFKAGGGGYKKGDVIAAENVQVKYAATTDFSDTTKISDVSVAVDDLVVDPLNRYIYLLGSSKANIYSTAGNLIATVSGSFSSSYKYRYFFDETGNLYWCNGTDYYKVTPSGTRSLFFSLSNSTNVGAWYNDRAYFISGSTFYHVNADGGIISQYTLSSSISGDFIGVDDAGSIYLYVYSTPFYYFKKFSSTGSQVWSNTSTDDVFYSKRMVCIGGYMYYSNDHYLKRMSLSGTYDSNTFGYIGSGYCVLKTFLIGNTTYVASVDSGKYIKVFDLDQKAVVYTLPTTYYTADCSELGEIYGSISSPGMLIKQHQKPIGYEVKEVAK